MEPAPELRVEIVNRQRRHPVDRTRLLRAARAAHAAGRGPGGSIAILLSGDARLRDLNREFRGKDRPTDVLSFADGTTGPEGRHLGDVAISVETAARNARDRGNAPADELDRLVAHGVLHVLGYDHEVDDGEMMALQARVLRRLRRGTAA